MTAELSAPDTSQTSVPQAFVKVDGVEKAFRTRGHLLRALDRITLDLAEGEFVSVVGPSGCGKSTLLMLVAGLLAPTAGEVVILGDRVTRPYTRLGVVFQQDALLPWRSVLDNVLLQIDVRGLDRRQYAPTARALLARVGLDGFEAYYPAELSGGMRQRVALCRALVHDPPLLLMDEPFGALDALTREQMVVDLQRLWLETRKTVLFITHSIWEAIFLADRVLVMSPRPARIAAVLSIDLPRPRRLALRESPYFGRYAAEVRQHFHAFGLLSET
jgi:NitT/TauT family transport system ATP-binding protein